MCMLRIAYAICGDFIIVIASSVDSFFCIFCFSSFFVAAVLSFGNRLNPARKLSFDTSGNGGSVGGTMETIATIYYCDCQVIVAHFLFHVSFIPILVGERLIQYASENLVTEILIHPQYNTLIQCMRNMLSSFTKHRHIIHSGYTFSGNGSWILQVNL